ncbi:MAG: flagellar hook basal-body protein [Deltaproteobacteria bacterium]|nr:flagellar hook basal-body protein [Deltaproteobacteria bacterium]
MDRGVFVALSGGIAEDRRLTTLTNNLANTNTIGFKKDKPIFKMIDPAVASQGIIDYRDISASASLPIKTFVEQQSTATDISQGEIKKTGNPLDAAISGDGFFKVSTPNGDRYTRQGSFTLDSEGRLVTKDGYSVMGEGGVITLTPGKIEIASDQRNDCND